MSQVIGGEFSIEQSMLKQKENRINSSEFMAFSSGRGALFSILQDIEKTLGCKKRCLLPDYLCDSITGIVDDAKWEREFYHVEKDLTIDLASIDFIVDEKTTNVFLFINYFGIRNHQKLIADLKKKYPNSIIIMDNVQAFFEPEKQQYADYSFNSFRKWFPCPDGASASKYGSKIVETFRETGIWMKYKAAGNILKSYDFVEDAIALELLEKGEELLETQYKVNCSDLSKSIFAGLDLEEIKETRKKNAYYLHRELERLGITHYYEEEAVPLFVPILVTERDSLRSEFFAKNIFVPKHWPHMSDELNGTNELYELELSLICDQRYSENDMERQINIIEKWMERRR